VRLLQARPAAVGHGVTVTWAGRTVTADHGRARDGGQHAATAWTWAGQTRTHNPPGGDAQAAHGDRAMKDFSLPRSGDEPLTFRGELIVSQDFAVNGEFYLDAEGKVRGRKHVWIVSMSLFRTDDGRFAYHGQGRTKPPVKPLHAVGRFETPDEHKEALAFMEELRRCDGFKPGPLRLGTS